MIFLRRWALLLLVLSLCALPLRGDAATSITFTIPNVFATASGNVPASQLDTNFTGILNAVSGVALAQRDLGVLTGYLGGCGLSNDAGSPNTVMDVAACTVADSTAASLFKLGAFTGSTAGTWVVGTGANKMDTGAVASNTWYHVHVIGNAAGTTVDMVFSLSATAPTLPSGYTLFRRIGSFKTASASTNILPFVQDGDLFQWKDPTTLALDFDATNPGTAAVTRTLNVPTGINVIAVLNVVSRSTVTGSEVYLSDLATTDVAASTTASPLGQLGDNANATNTPQASGQVQVRTNTSAQIRSRNSGSDANTILRGQVTGWLDRRGKG